MISSVNAQIGKETLDTGFHVTTPNPFMIQRMLRRAIISGEDYFVLETTSHALDQNRVLGVNFEIGVLTNITHEHLDYHQTLQNYIRTKVKLLERAKYAIINRDDTSYEKVVHLINKNKITTYGIENPAEVTPKTFPFKTNLPGRYNQYNCLAAVAACLKLGISGKHIRYALTTVQNVKGRMETVYDKQFKVIIDFAHTPNAISEVLKTLKPNVEGRLIHVFGSAGLRDKTKRPLMGETSDNYADVCILTAEDPRTENVNDIINAIAAGFIKHKPLCIPERQEAINYAVKQAAKGDVILITGKGHEQSMCFGKTEYPWSEEGVVRKAVRKYGK
jgi:UDP-N-acetylmuramoyl-L-alanyl-D-glutamate--2,6-diaminopimelate ligase